MLTSQSPIRAGATTRSTRHRDVETSRRGMPNAPPIGKKSIHRFSKKPGLPPRFLEELRYAQLSRSVSESALGYMDNEDYYDVADMRQSGATDLTRDPSIDLRTPVQSHRRDSTLRLELMSRTKSMRLLQSDTSDDEGMNPSLEALEEGDVESKAEDEPADEASEGVTAPPTPPPPPPPPLRLRTPLKP
jgi:cytokinesis protein